MEQTQHEIENNETLTHFILREMKKHAEATGQLTVLLHSIEIACKFISSKVRAAGKLMIRIFINNTKVSLNFMEQKEAQMFKERL